MYNLSDWGNALRIIEYFGSILLFCPEVASFFVWDTKRWRLDNGYLVWRIAKQSIRKTQEIAIHFKEETDRIQLLKHTINSESTFRIKAMIDNLKSEKSIVTSMIKFDQNKWLFNVLNGTYDLYDNVFRGHQKENLITKISPIKYNSTATCPLWIDFLRCIFEDDSSLILYVQKIIGICLTGITTERLFFILFGPGANGKSTFLNVNTALFGEYALNIKATALLRNYNSSTINNDIAEMIGARFITTSEIEEGKTLKTALIKLLTGGDVVTARKLYENNRSFIPEGKILMATNHKPIISETTDAIWDRTRLIPFNRSIPKGERDKNLTEKLKQELPGILNWAIEGCRLWRENGLDTPKSVHQATNEYRREMDTIGLFLGETCIKKAGERVSIRKLYSLYSLWCFDNRISALGKYTFGSRLKERGYEQNRNSTERYWKNLGLNDQYADISRDDFFSEYPA